MFGAYALFGVELARISECAAVPTGKVKAIEFVTIERHTGVRPREGV